MGTAILGRYLKLRGTTNFIGEDILKNACEQIPHERPLFYGKLNYEPR